MNRFFLLAGLFLSFSGSVFCNQVTFKILPGEKWWGGVDCFPTRGGEIMASPYDAHTDITLDLNHNYSNHAAPLFLSSKGRYIWSDGPFRIEFKKGEIFVDSDCDQVSIVQAGNTLRDAYMQACASHFPPSGKIPAEDFIASPQYNTWIELMYNQNQADILRYAHAVVDNGFPPKAILMVDDNWQKYYGNFEFKPERFPNPREMCDELHGLGFKIMLWVCPFVSPDSPEFRDLRDKGLLVRRKGSNEPYISGWWNGYSSVIDMSNPDSREWFVGQLHKLQEEYLIDGFKFDAGDANFYPESQIDVHDGKSFGTLHTELFASLYEDFPYHEFRANWKTQNKPVVLRLQDKDYSWSGVQSLIPSIIAASMEGHLFVCPDLIGGGSFTKFLNIGPDEHDQDLIVRSCQIHAFMPMMQFSVAPWRVLDEEHLDICRHYANLHLEMSGYILDQCKKCAVSGEPVVRPMEYSFPGQGLEDCRDQFMLGDDYLIAPVVTPGYQRTVALPRGVWVDENGRKYKGGRTYSIEVPIGRVPVFYCATNS